MKIQIIVIIATLPQLFAGTAENEKYYTFIGSSAQILVDAVASGENDEKIMDTSRMIYLASIIRRGKLDENEKKLVYRELNTNNSRIIMYWIFESLSELGAADNGVELEKYIINSCSESARQEAFKAVEHHAALGNELAFNIYKRIVKPSDVEKFKIIQKLFERNRDKAEGPVQQPQK